MYVCVDSAWKILEVSLDVTDSEKKKKKEIRDSLIFWGKRFGRPKKKYLGLGQLRIFFFWFFCIDQDYLFFLLATVRPN